MDNGSVSFAVCDDDEIVCEAICNRIGKTIRSCGISVTIDKYVSPVMLCKKIEDGSRRYDALFLDIDMPKMNGVELAKAVKGLDNAPEIIFVSNREDKVFESFAVRPFGFVRKNNFSHDLSDTLRSYISLHIINNTFIALKTNNNSVVRKVCVSDIVYIESFRYKQFVYMSDGEQIECRMSMDEFEKKLAEYDIIRVYKGYLVNLKYVQRIDKNGVVVQYKDGVNINVSRDRVSELKVVYLNYLRKMGAVLFDEE